MTGFTLLLILTTIGMTAAWWRTDGQLQRAQRRVNRAEYALAQQRLRIRQLAIERDRAYAHADEATLLLNAGHGTCSTPGLRLVQADGSTWECTS